MAETKKQTVWVANDAGHPYHKVRDLLGQEVDIKPLTLDDVNPLQIDRLCRHMARGVGAFVEKEDYLLISGTPIVNALAMLLWIEKHGQVQVIQWDAKHREYILATLELENVKNQLDFAITGVRSY